MEKSALSDPSPNQIPDPYFQTGYPNQSPAPNYVVNQNPYGYNPQPVTSYGVPPPYGNGQAYQQQGQVPQTVVVTGQPQVIYQPVMMHRTFCGHIVFSCFVFWCCGWIFGLVAFILALVAADKETSGRREEATRLGHASMGVSIAGVVVGLIVAAIVIGVVVSNASSTVSDTYSSSYKNYNSNIYGY